MRWTAKCFKEDRDQHYRMPLDQSGGTRTGLTTGVSDTAIAGHFDKTGFAGVVWVKV